MAQCKFNGLLGRTVLAEKGVAAVGCWRERNIVPRVDQEVLLRSFAPWTWLCDERLP